MPFWQKQSWVRLVRRSTFTQVRMHNQVYTRFCTRTPPVNQHLSLIFESVFVLFQLPAGKLPLVPQARSCESSSLFVNVHLLETQTRSLNLEDKIRLNWLYLPPLVPPVILLQTSIYLLELYHCHLEHGILHVSSSKHVEEKPHRKQRLLLLLNKDILIITGSHYLPYFTLCRSLRSLHHSTFIKKKLKKYVLYSESVSLLILGAPNCIKPHCCSEKMTTWTSLSACMSLSCPLKLQLTEADGIMIAFTLKETLQTDHDPTCSNWLCRA